MQLPKQMPMQMQMHMQLPKQLPKQMPMQMECRDCSRKMALPTHLQNLQKQHIAVVSDRQMQVVPMLLDTFVAAEICVTITLTSAVIIMRFCLESAIQSRAFKDF